jgi:hypothetical protein
MADLNVVTKYADAKISSVAWCPTSGGAMKTLVTGSYDTAVWLCALCLPCVGC